MDMGKDAGARLDLEAVILQLKDLTRRPLRAHSVMACLSSPAAPLRQTRDEDVDFPVDVPRRATRFSV